MIERLTDDDLRDLLSQWRSEPPVFEVIDECLALRARVAKLEAALKKVVNREPWKGRKNYSYDDAGLADYWSDMAKEFQEAARTALAE